MASVSYGLNVGLGAYNDPQAITVGSVAASGNDMVFSIDKTKGITTEQAVLALECFKNRLLTGGIGNLDIVNI